MRVPLRLTTKLAAYIMGQHIKGIERYPVVAMLEPLHTCNLSCIGCTPDRWAGKKEDWLSVEQCLEAMDECGAPIVSICGGEPLVYPELDRLTQGLIRRGRFVIICTNALLMSRVLPKLPSSPNLSFAVHIDGLAKTHDHITKSPGCFRKAVDAIKMLQDRGIRATTNTTVFAESDLDEMIELFRYLKEDVKVDALLVAPGYDFDQTNDETIFLKRQQVNERFQKIFERCPKHWFGNSTLYLEFLEGYADLTCTAWGNPVLTPNGWQGPCYMLRDGYHQTYRELLDRTDWSKYGPESGDPRCKKCMMHCGFEPTVATGRGIPMWTQLRNAVTSIA